jgi:hypothetical protein
VLTVATMRGLVTLGVINLALGLLGHSSCPSYRHRQRQPVFQDRLRQAFLINLADLGFRKLNDANDVLPERFRVPLLLG